MVADNFNCSLPSWGEQLPARITGVHPRSRELFTPADPPRPTCTPRSQHRAPQLHLPVTNTRAHCDRVQVAPTETEAAPAVEGHRAGRGVSARGAHRSTTALGPRPGVLSLRPVAATPELSPGPREARAPRGWKSPGRWPLGRQGPAVRDSR